MKGWAAWWGVGGVVLLLVDAVIRLVPHALAPFFDGSMSGTVAGAYAASVLFLGFFEGYRGFQLAFAPRAVARALTLGAGPAWHRALAPLHVMALFDAPPRRLWINRALLGGIIALIVSVRALPHPWRSVVDAGVVVGLTWGTVAMVVCAVRAARGTPPSIDPELGPSAEQPTARPR